MKKFHALTLFFFLIVGMTNVAAQKKIDEGKISLELNKIESSDASTAGMLKMMEGSTIIVNFNKEKTLTETDMMGGMMKTTTYVEKDSNKTIIIMDMMGTKQMAESKEDKKEAAKPEIDITYDKEDTKKILDYTCHRADIKVKTNNGQNMEMTAYVTEEIEFGANLMQAVDSESIKGVPLEYSISVNQKGMKFSMTFTVTEILDSVDAEVFNLKTDGIPKVEMDQLMQGAGGLGF